MRVFFVVWLNHRKTGGEICTPHHQITPILLYFLNHTVNHAHNYLLQAAVINTTFMKLKSPENILQRKTRIPKNTANTINI